MNKYLKSGFTLVELLIVIIIVAVLAAVVLVAINPAEQRAKALMSTGRSNTASICRAQALCSVEKDISECAQFSDPSATPAIEAVDMANPSDGTWTYTFDVGPNYGVIATAANTIQADKTFTLTCQNVSPTNRGQVWCDDTVGGGSYSCVGLGFDAALVVTP